MAGIEKFIEGLMADYNLSVEKMAAKLNMKSTATLYQLLRGKGNSVMFRMFERTVMRYLPLSMAEENALHAAVREALAENPQNGLEREMWAFLNEQPENAASENYPFVDITTGRVLTMPGRYGQARRLCITLFNCAYVPLYGTLKQLLGMMENVQIEHFVYVDNDDERTIRLVNVTQDLMYDKNYACYTRIGGDRHTWGIERSDFMLINWVDENDTEQCDLIICDENSCGTVVNRDGQMLNVDALGINRSEYTPVKRNLVQTGTMEDYIRLSRDYAEMENGRAVYEMKPDVCIAYVPTDILRQAAIEGVIPLTEENAPFIEEMTRLYAMRYNNIISRKQPTHMYLKQGAMEDFVRTGRLRGHFWALRPFTPGERKRILVGLLKLMSENPAFELYFFRDDRLLRDIEITCYEGIGALITAGQTDYNLDSGHTEVMLDGKVFMRLFEDFAREKLSTHVTNERDTRQILKRLIALCDELEAKEGM